VDFQLGWTRFGYVTGSSRSNGRPDYKRYFVTRVPLSTSLQNHCSSLKNILKCARKKPLILQVKHVMLQSRFKHQIAKPTLRLESNPLWVASK